MPGLKVVVLTRDEAGNAAWSKQLVDTGKPVYSLPCIKTHVVDSTLPPLDGFRWVTLTSPRAARYYQSLLNDANSPTVAALGEATAKAASSIGLKVGFIARSPDASALAKSLNPVEGHRVLVVQADIAPSTLSDILSSRGAQVTVITAYETLAITSPDLKLQKLLSDGAVNAIVFASPSALTGFMGRVGERLSSARKVKTIALGPSVAKALSQAGFLHVKTVTYPQLDKVIELI